MFSLQVYPAVQGSETKFRAVEVNPNVPRVFGDCQVHVSDVDAIVEFESEIFELPSPPGTPEDEKIGALIAERIEKATPPAPFTHGDLIEASKLIHAYSERMEAYGAWMFRARELANRLADAGHADPTP